MNSSTKFQEVPNPEVKDPGSKRKRHRHTAEYKLRILKEADLCRGEKGALSALLRREGIYSSHLSDWRKQRDKGTLSAFSKKRGVKPKYSPQDREVERLKAENRRLENRLRQASLIIEAQKKFAEALGIPLDPVNEEERQ